MTQGYDPLTQYKFDDDDGVIGANMKILVTQGVIGRTLVQVFNSLACVKDWRKLYCVLTIILKKRLEGKTPGWTWNPALAQPANVHDLIYKTKIRFLCMHRVRHIQLEGQKRQASFDCALMGIRPVKSVHECNVRDTNVRIPASMSHLGSCGTVWKTTKDNLMQNQCVNVPMTIGIASTSITDETFAHSEVAYYRALSREKAEAASMAEQRSWKDFVIGLSLSRDVRCAVHPADFDHAFHLRLEEFGSNVKANLNTKSAQNQAGKFINHWATKAVETIQRTLFTEKKSKSFHYEMPEATSMVTADAFIASMKESASKVSQSKWSFPPNRIPTPQALHAVVHLVFLTGPAESFKQEEPSEFRNIGLDNLCRLIKSKGAGELEVLQTCFKITDVRYKQTVSGIARLSASRSTTTPTLLLFLRPTSTPVFMFPIHKNGF